MMNLQLDVQPATEQRLRKALSHVHDNDETFAQNIIAFRVGELKKAIQNIKLDLQNLEHRYQITSASFYQQFTKGEVDDSEDNMLWAGLCEMLQQNEQELTELQ